MDYKKEFNKMIKDDPTLVGTALIQIGRAGITFDIDEATDVLDYWMDTYSLTVAQYLVLHLKQHDCHKVKEMLNVICNDVDQKIHEAVQQLCGEMGLTNRLIELSHNEKLAAEMLKEQENGS